jgi:hypothetical protein
MRSVGTTAQTSAGPEPDLSGDPRQLVASLETHLKLVLERVTDLADTEAGFPLWLAKRRHDDALRLEAAAEVGA